MNWIFNINSIGGIKNDQKITFTQKRKFSGEIGENIIILDYKKNTWVFTKYYEISGIDQEKLDESTNRITIGLKLKNIFEDPKLVEDYSYSLLRVTNFKNPQNHFNRRYSRIEDVEFEAIVNDRIYTKRTILGTIFNSMHKDHQKSFILYLAEKDSNILIEKPNVNKALDYLYEYLEQSVIDPIYYIKEIAEIYENIFDADELKEVAFVDSIENIKTRNRIKLQTDIIEEYQEFISSTTRISLNNINDNYKFINLFNRSPLPFKLK